MIGFDVVHVDLNAPWGPAEAGRDLDRYPAIILAHALKFVHTDVHAQIAEDRSAAKRRPWRWHTLRGLRREERRLCREVSRRAALLLDVVQAREAEGAE